MRLGFYVPAWPPEGNANGIITSVATTCKTLRELGHEVFLVAGRLQSHNSEFPVLEIAPEVRGPTIWLKRKLYPEKALQDSIALRIRHATLKLIEQNRIELLEMEETQGWSHQVARGLPIPVVTRLHGPWFKLCRFIQSGTADSQGRIDREYTAIAHSFAVSTPSKKLSEEIAEVRSTHSPGSTSFLPNPMAVSANADSWSVAHADRNLLLFVGRFDYLKGADVLLKAFDTIVRKRPETMLAFAGPDVGIYSQSGRRYSLREYAQTHLSDNALKNLRYYGLANQAILKELRKRAFITIITSRYETFGNTVAEAMSVGSPIIASDVGGIADMLSNNNSALLVPPGDVESLVDAINLLLNEPNLAPFIGLKAQLACEKLLNPHHVAEMTLEFYRCTIKRHRNKLPTERINK